MRRSDTFRKVLREAKERRGVALVGILNVTPDSFSDGGAFYSKESAREHVLRLLEEGADIVDIGAESTRPGAQPVPARDQLDRLLEVVAFASERACVSVDTTSPEVASATLLAGASAINDVSCLRDDGLAQVVASHAAALVLMHARGTQTDMAGFSTYPDHGYRDVVSEVVSEWEHAAQRAASRGVPREALVMDPGLGFAKNARQSAEILERLPSVVRAVGVPVLVGASRKSFLKLVDAGASPKERLGSSIAAALHSVRAGASAVRVHDVRATRQAVDLERLLGGAAAREQGASAHA